MSRRCRKRHVQQSLELRTHGGKRRGAGRPRKGRRKNEPHVKRPSLSRRSPAHTILRVEKDIATLRKRDAYHAIRIALRSSLRRPDFRVVHMSLQRKHIHLVVEADDACALARGMRGLEIAMAKRLNTAISDGRGTRRTGRVFRDRYHARILRSPRDVRNVIGYVLNNWRHHDEHRELEAMSWDVDYFSSGPTFDGWAEARDRRYRRSINL